MHTSNSQIKFTNQNTGIQNVKHHQCFLYLLNEEVDIGTILTNQPMNQQTNETNNETASQQAKQHAS